MKRAVLGVFSLIAWVLVACTILSVRVEGLMTARVVTVPRGAYGYPALPIESLSYDRMGCHLFEMTEGAGWESGLRAYEVYSGNYSIVERKDDTIQRVMASSGLNEKLIQFSSRPLKEGELVEELTGQETADDMYLVAFWEAAPELGQLSTLLKLEDRTDTTLLLSATKAPQPFLETRVRDQLYQFEELRPYIHPMTAAYTRVYSLRAVEQFMESVPRLALLLVMLLFPVVLWAGSCALLRRRKGGGWLALINIAIAGLDAGCMFRVANAVELPTSLLPVEMVFDFGHYTSEFGRIFDALGAFGGNQMVQDVLGTAESALHKAAVILLVGLLLAVFAVVAEGVAFSRRRRSSAQAHTQYGQNV